MAQSGDLPVTARSLGVQEADPLPCSDLAVGGRSIKRLSVLGFTDKIIFTLPSFRGEPD